jgi:hypothetical protein
MCHGTRRDPEFLGVLRRHETLHFEVATFQKDKARYVFTFTDSVADGEVKPVRTLPVPTGEYRVLIRAESRSMAPVEQYFVRSLRDGEVALVSADGAEADRPHLHGSR